MFAKNKSLVALATQAQKTETQNQNKNKRKFDDFVRVQKNPETHSDDDEEAAVVEEPRYSTESNKVQKKKASRKQRKEQLEEEKLARLHAEKEFERALTASVFTEDNVSEIIMNNEADNTEGSDFGSFASLTKDVKLKPAWVDPNTESSAMSQIPVTAVVPIDEGLQKASADIIVKKKPKKIVTKAVPTVTGSETRMREIYQQLNPTAEWASIKRGATDLDDDVFKSTKSLVAANDDLLPQGEINMSYCVDANRNADIQTRMPIVNVRFHPHGQLLLTTSFERKLRLVHLNGMNNPIVATVDFELRPRSSQFSHDGLKVYTSFNNSTSLNTIDIKTAQSTTFVKLPNCPHDSEMISQISVSPDNRTIAGCSEKGLIHFVTAENNLWAYSLRLNEDVNAIQYCKDNENILYAAGALGKVYIWDLRKRRCINVFADHGNTTTLSLHDNSKYLVTGSTGGIVNVYDHTQAMNQRAPKPIKTIDNLTTPVDTVKFNHDSQLLGMSSSVVGSGIRLAHTASWTVYSNFPGTGFSDKSYHKIGDMDFSVNGGMLAVAYGTKAQLYRIQHYSHI